MEICKVCNEEYKAITMTHIRKHNMTRPEYDSYVQTDPDFVEDTLLVDDQEVEGLEDVQPVQPVQPDSISGKEQRKNIFKGSHEEKDENRPLSEFLDEFSITEKELRNITRKYKDGVPIPLSQQMMNHTKVGSDKAKELSDQTKVETSSLNIAESLVTEYGFTVITVKRDPQKTWFLEKT